MKYNTLIIISIILMLLVSCNYTSAVLSEKPVLTVPEAETILSERFDRLHRITYLPEMDKQENGILHYGFSVDCTEPIAFAYAWVNSVTGRMSFEESEPYDNIPDSMFPIPMSNGEVIPYDYYVPPDHAWSGGYKFWDKDLLIIYQTQLRVAGFVDNGNVMSIASLWTYERDNDVLIVELLYDENEEGFTICPYVSSY